MAGVWFAECWCADQEHKGTSTENLIVRSDITYDNYQALKKTSAGAHKSAIYAVD